MYSLKDTHFWFCSFLFIVPVVKNVLKLYVNPQFIAPSLYNQITWLIFITDIFKPRIKIMYNTFWQRSLFVWGQLFSVKIFDRSRSGFQVFRLGAGDDFCGPSGHALPLPLRVSLSRTHSFLRPLLPSTCYTGYNFPEASTRKECKITHYCFVNPHYLWGFGG